MVVVKIERDACDWCRRFPNGNDPDSILWLKCGHVICDKCQDRCRRKFSEECPKCKEKK